jgi:4-amino-4-deoxy-L-arabinose transferase-like glycosyltransferase
LRPKRPAVTQSPLWPSRRWAFLLVALTILVRLPALVHPAALDDEAVYSVVAIEIVHGGQPYINGVERKPPLLFWTYAAVLGTLGTANWPGLHLVSLVWVLATMAGLYAISRRLFDPVTGLVAALLYSIYQPWLSWKNLAFNGEMMMNLPIVLAVLLVFRPSQSRRRPELLVAGGLLAAAFLLKQPAAAAAVPLGIYLLLPSYRRARGLVQLDSVIQGALLTIGFAGTLGLVALVLAKQGILGEAFYWTITDHDLPNGPLDPVFWYQAQGQLVNFVLACAPLVMGAVISARARDADGSRYWRELRPELTALLLLVVASMIGVSASGRFYPHYFIQLVPPLVLLAAPVYARLWTRPDLARRGWRSPARLSQAWLTLTVVVFFTSYVRGLAPLRHNSEVGTYIEEHSTLDDRIFVWGQAPSLYLDAHRRPASRYVATFPLTGYIFGSPLSWDPRYDTSDRILPGAWATLERDLTAHPPLYIVDTDGITHVAKYPIARFPFLNQLVTTHYRLVLRAPEGLIYRRIENDSPALPPT